jgi:transposase-like protein
MTLYQKGLARYEGESVDILYSPLKIALARYSALNNERYADIARNVGISPNTLRNALYRAKHPYHGPNGARVSKALAYALAEYLGITLSSFTLDVNERRKWTRLK